MITMKTFDELTTRELYEILRLRSEIFVVEQDCVYQDVDRKDYGSLHLYIKEGSEIVAYIRVLKAGVAYENMASIGRIIVKKEARGKNYARTLINKGIEYIKDELKEEKIKIQAQEYLLKFYGSFGFKRVSETYLEDGLPHVDMILELGK